MLPIPTTLKKKSMPVDRAFLQPRSVAAPPQGDFTFPPVVKIYEADSAAGLELLMDGDFSIQAASIAEFWVIESVQYATTVVKPEVGMNPAVVLYSALVWATQVKKV